MRKVSGAGDARAAAAAAAAAQSSFTGHDDGRDAGRRRSSSVSRLELRGERESGEAGRDRALSLASGSERGGAAGDAANYVSDGIDPRLRRSCPLCARRGAGAKAAK